MPTKQRRNASGTTSLQLVLYLALFVTRKKCFQVNSACLSDIDYFCRFFYRMYFSLIWEFSVGNLNCLSFSPWGEPKSQVLNDNKFLMLVTFLQIFARAVHLC